MAAITPGGYLKGRRIAARLTLHDVADRIATEPHWSALVRANWLEQMEADIEPISIGTLAALSAIFPFDVAVIFELERHRLGIEEAKTPICVMCGAIERDACAFTYSTACIWTEVPPAAGAAA